jgi:quinol monooxygenase YgiN
MSENVYWLLLLAVTPGWFDDLKSLMTEMVEATQRNEIGALDYEWAISEDRGVCDRLRTAPRFRWPRMSDDLRP